MVLVEYAQLDVTTADWIWHLITRPQEAAKVSTAVCACREDRTAARCLGYGGGGAV